MDVTPITCHLSLNIINMNLYIFNEIRRGAVYGVGTYIRELIDALKGSDIHIGVLHLLSDKPYIQTEETENIKHWYFPAPVQEQRTASIEEQRRLYFHNIVYLLQLYIEDTKSLIFHLNFPESRDLAEKLKQTFDCRIVSVVHFTGWGFTIFDNLPRLRTMLTDEHPDSIGENVKKTVVEDGLLYSKVDRCVCLSNYMQEIMCRDYGLDVTKITVVPNGLSNVKHASASSRFLRKKWNIQAGEKIILFAGRMDEIKGVSYLITAFHHVLEVYPQSRLVIAGAGDFSRYTKESQDICTKITYTGLLDKDQLYEWYRLADVGVIPSLFEPFGFVAVEMMMHSLPMVVTATSGMNEIVDESCGLKIPLTILPDSVEIDTSLLAEKIIYLLQNPAEAKYFGRNARRRYLEKYTSHVFKKNMVAFYKYLFLVR